MYLCITLSFDRKQNRASWIHASKMWTPTFTPSTWEDVKDPRFEILTAMVVKISIFWDITLCSPLKVNLRFGGICRLHLQGRRISKARHLLHAGGTNRHETDLSHCLFSHPEDEGDMFLRNVG
jgi:hypothetical protein